MQKCTKCKSKFSYKELMLAYWSFDYGSSLECKSCKSKYKLSIISRIIVALMISLPILVNKYLSELGLNVLICYLIYIAVLFISIPACVKYNLVND